MLTSDTRKLLKQMRSLVDGNKYHVMIGPGYNTLYVRTTPSRIVPAQNSRPDELPEQLAFLEEQGYIAQESAGYILTYKGLHPKKIAWGIIWRFLLKSILIPIVVSVATTLIALLLSGAL